VVQLRKKYNIAEYLFNINIINIFYIKKLYISNINIYIYIQEFKNFWKAVNNKKKVSSSEEEAMFKALDSNGDGHISFNECKLIL